MDYASIMHGSFTAYAWIVHVLRVMDYAWNVYGLYMDYAWIMCAICMDYAGMPSLQHSSRSKRSWNVTSGFVNPSRGKLTFS